MNIGVMFSSGLDSTFLMWKNLEEGHKVYPIYVDLGNNKLKAEREREQAKKLISLFRDKYGSRMVEALDVPVEVNISGNRTNASLVQIPVWLFGAIWIQTEPIDELQMGYVMGDQALSYLEDIKAIYNSYGRLTLPYDGKGMIPLTFPLMKYDKYYMLKHLPQPFIKEVWACEAGNYGQDNTKPCGRCEPCTKYKAMFEEIGDDAPDAPLLVDPNHSPDNGKKYAIESIKMETGLSKDWHIRDTVTAESGAPYEWKSV